MSKRLELLDKLINKGSEDPFVHYGRAMELKGLDRIEEAMEAFQGVRERFPEYVPNYLIAAQVAEELGQRERAIVLLRDGKDIARRQGNDHALGEISELLDQLAEQE